MVEQSSFTLIALVVVVVVIGLMETRLKQASYAILGSVIKRPRNKSFLRAISDSMELRPDSLCSNRLGANLGT